MIVEYVRYTVADAVRRQALVEAYALAALSLDAAPECRAYELSTCDADPTSAVLRIEWTSPEAHRNGFRKGPGFATFLAAITPFIGEIAEMRHYAVTSVFRRK